MARAKPLRPIFQPGYGRSQVPGGPSPGDRDLARIGTVAGMANSLLSSRVIPALVQGIGGAVNSIMGAVGSGGDETAEPGPGMMGQMGAAPVGQPGLMQPSPGSGGGMPPAPPPQGAGEQPAQPAIAAQPPLNRDALRRLPPQDMALLRGMAADMKAGESQASVVTKYAQQAGGYGRAVKMAEVVKRFLAETGGLAMPSGPHISSAVALASEPVGERGATIDRMVAAGVPLAEAWQQSDAAYAQGITRGGEQATPEAVPGPPAAVEAPIGAAAPQRELRPSRGDPFEGLPPAQGAVMNLPPSGGEDPWSLRAKQARTYEDVIGLARDADMPAKRTEVMRLAQETARAESGYDYLLGSHKRRAALEVAKMFPKDQEPVSEADRALAYQRYMAGDKSAMQTTDIGATMQGRIGRTEAQTEASRASAGLANTRGKDIEARQPSIIGRNAAQAEASRASAGLATARAKTENLLRDARRRKIEAEILAMGRRASAALISARASWSRAGTAARGQERMERNDVTQSIRTVYTQEYAPLARLRNDLQSELNKALTAANAQVPPGVPAGSPQYTAMVAAIEDARAAVPILRDNLATITTTIANLEIEVRRNISLAPAELQDALKRDFAAIESAETEDL